MTIQTYGVGDLPPEGPQNLLDGKFQIAFKIVGGPKKDYSIDPRAGRLEYTMVTR